MPPCRRQMLVRPEKRASSQSDLRPSATAVCASRTGIWKADRLSISESHCDPIVLDLAFPAELVGQFVPGRRDIVRALLRGLLAGEDLLQFVLGDAVILESAGNSRLDRRVRVIIRGRLRIHVGTDILLVVSGQRPEIEIGVTL